MNDAKRKAKRFEWWLVAGGLAVFGAIVATAALAQEQGTSVGHQMIVENPVLIDRGAGLLHPYISCNQRGKDGRIRRRPC